MITPSDLDKRHLFSSAYGNSGVTDRAHWDLACVVRNSHGAIGCILARVHSAYFFGIQIGGVAAQKGPQPCPISLPSKAITSRHPILAIVSGRPGGRTVSSFGFVNIGRQCRPTYYSQSDQLARSDGADCQLPLSSQQVSLIPQPASLRPFKYSARTKRMQWIGPLNAKSCCFSRCMISGL